MYSVRDLMALATDLVENLQQHVLLLNGIATANTREVDAHRPGAQTFSESECRQGYAAGLGSRSQAQRSADGKQGYDAAADKGLPGNTISGP